MNDCCNNSCDVCGNGLFDGSGIWIIIAIIVLIWLFGNNNGNCCC